MHQSIVEVGTRICGDVRELRDEIFRNRRELASAAERVGLAVAAAGTHPFSRWEDQIISPGVRYDNIVEELQQLARSLLIFGLHVHVGVPDRSVDDRLDERGPVFPAAPAGAVDELAVLDGTRHRAEVVPHDDLPPLSAHRRSRSFRLVERVRELHQAARRSALHRRRARRSGGMCGRIRRSARSSSASATCRRVPKTAVMLGALVQAIVVKLYKLRMRNLGFRIYRRALIEENKWRAARYGLDGKLIDFGKRAEVPMRELALELLEFVDDVVDELGSREEVEYVHTVLREGTSADQQLAVFRETNDLKAVVQHVVQRNAGLAVDVGTSRCDMQRASQDRRSSLRARVQLSARVHRARQRARGAARHHRGRWSSSAGPGWTSPRATA